MEATVSFSLLRLNTLRQLFSHIPIGKTALKVLKIEPEDEPKPPSDTAFLAQSSETKWYMKLKISRSPVEGGVKRKGGAEVGREVLRTTTSGFIASKNRVRWHARENPQVPDGIPSQKFKMAVALSLPVVVKFSLILNKSSTRYLFWSSTRRIPHKDVIPLRFIPEHWTGT